MATAPALDVRVLAVHRRHHDGDGARLWHRVPRLRPPAWISSPPSAAGGGRGADRSRPAAERAGRRRADAHRRCCWWRRGCCCAATPTCSRSNPGFNPRNLLVAETPLPPLKYAQTTERRSALLSTPCAIASPRSPASRLPDSRISRRSYSRAGARSSRPRASRRPRRRTLPHTWRSTASPARGISMRSGVPFVRGRDFDARDAQSSVPVAIVNRTMAERRWPSQDPIGRSIKFGPANVPGLWLTVVGVVGDVQETALDSRVEPEVYLPSNQGRDVPAVPLAAIPRGSHHGRSALRSRPRCERRSGASTAIRRCPTCGRWTTSSRPSS